MKVEIPCSYCLFEERNGSNWVDLKPIGNSCIYEVTCPLGHTSLMAIQNFKFDILFESGIQALRIGYHRETVSSFAVAMERFYEYCVTVLLMDTLMDMTTGHMKESGLINFEKLWKTPLKLSERQIGAFYALYFAEFREVPQIFDQSFSKKLNHKLVNNPVNFRNNVIHEGYIPSYEEAVQYGEAVYQYILSIYEILRRKKGQGDSPFRAVDLAFSVDIALAQVRRGEDMHSLPVTGPATFMHENVVLYPYYKGDEAPARQPLTEYILLRG